MTTRENRPVTMADVGARAGVSDRTVSNALSGKAYVAPATRDAVLRAVHELGYQMNVSARSLRTGRTGFITLAIPDLRIDYFVELAHAVMHEAEQHGWAVTLQQTGSRRERELAVLSGGNRLLSDGLIFQPHALDSQDRAALSGDQPMVLLGERIFGADVDHISVANVGAARAATDHLLAAGRRRIAVIGPNPSDHSETAATLRLSGHRLALEAAGLTFDEARVAPATQWRQSDGAAAVESLLRRAVSFDALLCFNDTLAFGALHALSRAGLRVPQDVAVMGIDNVAAAAFSTPALSTVDVGVADVARHAVQRLALRRGMVPPSPPQDVVADFRVVPRETT